MSKSEEKHRDWVRFATAKPCLSRVFSHCGAVEKPNKLNHKRERSKKQGLGTRRLSACLYLLFTAARLFQHAHCEHLFSDARLFQQPHCKQYRSLGPSFRPESRNPGDRMSRAGFWAGAVFPLMSSIGTGNAAFRRRLYPGFRQPHGNAADPAPALNIDKRSNHVIK